MDSLKSNAYMPMMKQYTIKQCSLNQVSEPTPQPIQLSSKSTNAFSVSNIIFKLQSVTVLFSLHSLDGQNKMTSGRKKMTGGRKKMTSGRKKMTSDGKTMTVTDHQSSYRFYDTSFYI